MDVNLTVSDNDNEALPSDIVNVLDGVELTAVTAPSVVVIVILPPLYIRQVLSLV